MDTMHLKENLVLVGFEGSALTLTLIISLKIIILCNCSSAMTKDYCLVIFHGTEWP